MKKITLSLLSSISFLVAQAQYEPDVRLLQNQVWTNIMQHDSIAYSSDSGAAFVAEEVASLWLFPDNHTDSLVLYDPITAVNIWDGKQNGNTTSIFSFDVPSTGDTSAAYYFFKDQMGRDSLLSVYSDNGFGQLTFDVAIEIRYNANNRVSNWLINVDFNGTGTWVQVQDYQFVYNSNRLDSVIVKDAFQGMTEGKLINTYNSGGELVQFDVLELDGNNELTPTTKYLFDHNSSGEINEVVELIYDEDSLQYFLSASWKYLNRQKNNISVSDQKKLGVTVYPNPAHNFINIKTSEELDSYSIMSLTGKILQKGEMKSRINVEDLHRGIYFLNLKKGDQTEIRKFQKL